jgi:hypothetical protein
MLVVVVVAHIKAEQQDLVDLVVAVMLAQQVEKM